MYTEKEISVIQCGENHPEVVDKDTMSMKMKGMKKGIVKSRDSEK